MVLIQYETAPQAFGRFACSLASNDFLADHSVSSIPTALYSAVSSQEIRHRCGPSLRRKSGARQTPHLNGYLWCFISYDTDLIFCIFIVAGYKILSRLCIHLVFHFTLWYLFYQNYHRFLQSLLPIRRNIKMKVFKLLVLGAGFAVSGVKTLSLHHSHGQVVNIMCLL